MVDSHCHIAGPEFVTDLPEVVARARAVGVTRALTILAAEDDDELARAAAVATAWPDVRFSIGVHPHAAGRFADAPHDSALTTAAALDRQPLARGLGEVGLDYHYDFAPRAAQRAVFSEQLALARARGLPVVIHTREAMDDTVAILQESKVAAGVFHCFTGDVAAARRALDVGLHLSLAGIVTFPRATELKAVAAFAPLDRLLIETDSPFLAPVPHRGGRNEPAYVARVCQVVAELRGTTAEALAAATTATFDALFNP